MPCEEIDSSHARTFETFPWYTRAAPLEGARVFGLNQTVVFMCMVGLARHTETQMGRCSRAAHDEGRSRAEHSAPLRRPGRHTDGQTDRCISLERAHALQIQCNQRSYSHEPPAGESGSVTR